MASEHANKKMSSSLPTHEALEGTLASEADRTMASAQFKGKGCANCEASVARGEPPLHPDGDHLPIEAMVLSHAPRAGPLKPMISGDKMTHRMRAAILCASKRIYSLPPPLQLEDGQARARLNPASFQVPKLRKCREVRLGDLVEVMFQGHASVGPGEYLWLEVVHIDSDRRSYIGMVTHIVFMTQHPNKEDLTSFKPTNIVNIIPREESAHYID